MSCQNDDVLLAYLRCSASLPGSALVAFFTVAHGLFVSSVYYFLYVYSIALLMVSLLFWFGLYGIMAGIRGCLVHYE